MRTKLTYLQPALALALPIAVTATLLSSDPAYAWDRGGRGWHGGGWGWGWGWGVGAATALAVDAALASPGYYSYPYAAYPAPVVAVIQPPTATVAAAPAAVPATSQSWYYCDNPKGYYPYVQSCQNAWQQVPATPPGAVQSNPQ